MPRNASTGGRQAPRVLIVEDNDAMRALIRSLVEEVTSTVQECASAEDALALYPGMRPDWVLMDIRLEGMDGIAATRALVEMDAGARVIIVTEHGDRGYQEAAREAGATGFVLKENLLELTSMLASGHHASPGG